MAETSAWLAGNLTDDPELRYNSSGTARATFRVAVPSRVATESSGGMVSRRSTRWWSGATRPSTRPRPAQGLPGGGRGPAGAAVLAGRRRQRPLGGPGRGGRARAEPQLGHGEHDQGDQAGLSQTRCLAGNAVACRVKGRAQRPRPGVPPGRTDTFTGSGARATIHRNRVMRAGGPMLSWLRALARRFRAGRRSARQRADPLLSQDAGRARARAKADYHNRVGDPGHGSGSM
jgi:hypothetical protein